MTSSVGSRLRQAWPLAAAAALALALGLWKLGQQSFDIDEGVSAYTATQPLRDAFDYAWGDEPNNILYFGFLTLWQKLASDQEFLRIPSVIAYSCAVPLTGAIAWRSFGRGAGIAAAFLLAVNAYALEMGQTARAFALLMALSSASTLCFILAVQRPTPLRWGSWAVFSALAIYAHPFGSFVLVAQGASLAWLPPDRVPWKRAAIAAGVVAAIALPLFLKLLAEGGGRISWIDPTSWDGAIDTLERLAGSGGYGTGIVRGRLVYLYAALTIVLAAMVLGRGQRRGQQAWFGMLAILWAILPLALAVAVSFIQPMFLEKYLIEVLPALAVVAAAVLTQLRPRPLAIAAVAGLCALHVTGIREWYVGEVNEDLRGAADRIGPRGAAQEKVFTSPDLGSALAWYLGREVSPTALPGPGSVGSVDEVENLDATEGEMLAATPRIWVVAARDYQAPIRQTFGERPVLERWYPERLRVTLLGPLQSQAQSNSSTTIP